MTHFVILPGVNSGAYLFKGVQALLPGVEGTPLPIPFTAGSYAQQA